MDASKVLNNARDLLLDRAKERDTGAERSMERCVKTFNAMTGHKLSVEDGWQFMVYLKHSRMRGGSFKQDDYEDAVAYGALMAEQAGSIQADPVSLEGLLPPPPARFVQGKEVPLGAPRGTNSTKAGPDMDTRYTTVAARGFKEGRAYWCEKLRTYVGLEDLEALDLTEADISPMNI